MSLGFHFRLNQNIENSQAFPIFENPWSSVKISHKNKKYYHKESKANSYWHKYPIDFLTLNVLYLLVSFDSDVNFGFVTFINDVILDAIERRGVSRYRRLRVNQYKVNANKMY